MVTQQRRLIFKALAAMDQLIDASRRGPIEPSLSIAFALAYLSAHGEGVRAHSASFYRAMQQTHADAHNNAFAVSMRKNELSACFAGIIRSLGLPSTPAMHAALRQGRVADTAAARRAACADFWAEVDQMNATGYS